MGSERQQGDLDPYILANGSNEKAVGAYLAT